MTQANSIVGNLQNAGFASSDISVLFPDKQGTKDFAHEHNTKAPEGAVAGAGAGGALGGTIGLLAGIGALAIPGLGPFARSAPKPISWTQAMQCVQSKIWQRCSARHLGPTPTILKCPKYGFNRPAARPAAMMAVFGQRAVRGLNLTKLLRGVAGKKKIALAL